MRDQTVSLLGPTKKNCNRPTVLKSVVNFYQNLIFSSPANAELIFRRLTASQSLELSCSPNKLSLRGLHLYHRGAQTQTTLLSMAKGGEIKVNPEHRGRLHHGGGLDSAQVNVTISHLQHNDTGLYMWELSYREENYSDLILSAEKVFLLVEGAGKWLKTSHYAYALLPFYLLLLLLMLRF